MVALLAASFVGAPAMAQDSNVLKVATTANITTWDPVSSFSTEAFYLANIYEQLLRINPPGSAEPYTPLLATEWSHSDDGLTWTFQIRPNVTFHDGSPLTADAVVASIQAAQAHGGASFIWAPLDSISATGPLTVEMKLKYAAPMDLVASSLYGAWIVSPTALAAAEAAYAYDPTADYYAAGIDGGTGPYTISSYTPDSEVLLKAYDGYWGGWTDTKHYDQVLVSIMAESIAQQQALDGGDVDIAFNVPLENIGQYESNSDYTVIKDPSFFNYVGLFNTGKPPLDDPKVREALSYAIPYGDIITVGAPELRHAVAWPGAGRGLPLRRDRPPVHVRPREGKAAPGRRRPSWRRVLDGDHLRLREPGRGTLRAAHPGLVPAAGHRREAHPDAVQPAVGSRQGRRCRAPGHVPAAVLADVLGRRLGQPLVPVPQPPTRRSSTCPTGPTRSTTA